MKPKTAGRLAWPVWSLTFLLVSATTVLRASNRPSSADILFTVLLCAMAIGYATVGGLVVSRHPRNAIGWLFAMIAFWLTLAALSHAYVARGLVVSPGSLPSVPYMALMNQIAFPLGLAPIPLVLLLFP